MSGEPDAADGTRETPAHTIMVQEGAQAVEAAGPDFAARFDAAQLRVLRGADGSNGADGLMVTRYYALTIATSAVLPVPGTEKQRKSQRIRKNIKK